MERVMLGLGRMGSGMAGRHPPVDPVVVHARNRSSQGEDSGGNQWRVAQALETGFLAPVIALSLLRRPRARKQDAFSDLIATASRRGSAGHAVRGPGDPKDHGPTIPHTMTVRMRPLAMQTG